MTAWIAKGYGGGYFDSEPETATFEDVQVGADRVQPRHHAAWDWIEDYKARRPTGWVVLYREGQRAVEHRVYLEDRIDGIFSSAYDAEAWAYRWQQEWGTKHWKIVASYFPEREPVVPRRTAWERLLADNPLL